MPKPGGDEGGRDAGLMIVYRGCSLRVERGYAVVKSLPMALLWGGAGGGWNLASRFLGSPPFPGGCPASHLDVYVEWDLLQERLEKNKLILS